MYGEVTKSMRVCFFLCLSNVLWMGLFLLMRRKALEALQEASVGERFELFHEQKLKVFQEEFSSSKASYIS